MQIAAKDLPSALPIFPLGGVLLLPGGRLPLNIFEPRYLTMVDDALKGDRLIGMIQPKGPCREGRDPAVYDIGCAGRIVSFTQQDDGRYAIVLCGVSRFKIASELEGEPVYRRVAPEWAPFRDDLTEAEATPLDRPRLTKLLHSYFTLHQLSADWAAIEKTPNRHLVTCLAMICPFEPAEKQALLEAANPMARANVMMGLMEVALATSQDCGKAH